MDCGKPLAFHRQGVVFTREKGGIPYWNRISAGVLRCLRGVIDNFDQAMQMERPGDVALSDEMRPRGPAEYLRGTHGHIHGFQHAGSGGGGGSSERAREAAAGLSVVIDQEELSRCSRMDGGSRHACPIRPASSRPGGRDQSPVYDRVDGKPLHQVCGGGPEAARRGRLPRRRRDSRPATW